MSQILLGPIITEKSMGSTAKGKYVFRVNDNANKQEIAKEVKKAYKVDVEQVNVINVRSKERRFRFKQVGQTIAWKKAVVSIKKGQRIEGFEIKEDKPNKKKQDKQDQNKEKDTK